MRLPSVAGHAPGQNGLLRVKPVFGFVKNRRLRAVDHLGGDFHATPRRKAMQDNGIAGGDIKKGLIHLKGTEIFAAGSLFVSH